MNKIFTSLLGILFLFSCSSPTELKEEKDFNFNWMFSLGADSSAISASFNDKDWKKVNLPHDWSVEFPFDTINGEGCVGYLPGGTGWYRKTFNAPNNKEVKVLFDGVYNNSEVWLNGHKLGFNPYGYSPFYFDLTPHLNASGKNNVIVVKVDRTRLADSRWYPGSGIYRNVELVITDKLHIPIWGTFITTPNVSKKRAEVVIKTNVQNSYINTKECELQTKILSPSGKEIAKKVSRLSIKPNLVKEIEQSIEVESPELWSIDSPILYKAISQILVGNQVVDEYETIFGIRTFNFDADKGFTLNGVNMKIKGVCLHHDGGLVGAAVPKGVWKRRLQTLKDGGCNAVRISHNPASVEFLELCDEMGFLVQDEFFDEWDYPKDKRLNTYERHDDYLSRGYAEHFQKWAERDLKATVLAHRNHPSIIQWSIGNEIEWTYPRNKKSTGFWDADWNGNYFWSPTPHTPDEIRRRYNNLDSLEYTIGTTAKKLSKWTKQLDTTRPVIANCILPSASYVTGYADALDIIGFSYRRVMYDYGHKHFPEKPLMGTENLGQWHEWKAIEERPFVSGTFLWTGIDYMGEAHHRKAGNKRRRGTRSGLLDYAGFTKPSYYMMKSLWNKEEATLFISTQTLSKSIYKEENGELVEKKKDAWQKALWEWQKVNKHWNYTDGEKIAVEIISNCPEVELFLNGESLGTKKLVDFEDRIYKWLVPFNSGKLEAKAEFKGKDIQRQVVSSSEPVGIQLFVDKTELDADGCDVTHIVAQLVDADGNPVMTKEKELTFEVNGDVKLLGVDNGDNHSFPVYQSNKIITFNGRALLVVQSTRQKGVSNIVALMDNAKSKEVTLSSN